MTDESEQKTKPRIKQEITVFCSDPKQFAQLLMVWAKRGAQLKSGKYVYLNSIPLRATLEIEVDADKEFKSDKNSICKRTLHPMTYEELDKMDWHDLVKMASSLGIPYGKKDRIISDYFDLMGKGC